MKKIITVLALLLCLALSAGVAACSDAGRGAGGGSSSGGKFDQLDTTESVYGFSAASAGMLISSMNGGSAAALATAKGYALPLSAQAVQTEQTGTENTGNEQTGAGENTENGGQTGTGENGGQTGAADDTQQIEAELDAYMALVESLLSDGGFQVQEGASDRGYETKMVVSYRDLNGKALQYELHYNSIARPDNDDDDDDDFDDRFENESEEEYGIEGVMVIDGADYAIRGERESESEGSETESETSFRVTLSDASYMLVEQSYESERNETEQEYSYSVFENGRLTERSSFEYEEEDGETELKMTSRKGGESSVFYFERETVRGEEVIRIRVGSGSAAQSYYVRVQTDADGNKDYVYEQIGR